MSITGNANDNIGRSLITTVNNGTILKNSTKIIELLSHTHHNPKYDIICLYYLEGYKKVELCVEKELNTNKITATTYFFDGGMSLQHNHSRHYDNISLMPNKYKLMVMDLTRYINLIDFNRIKGNMGVVSIAELSSLTVY